MRTTRRIILLFVLALCAASWAQTRKDGYTEVAIVTLGSDAVGPRMLVEKFPDGWTAGQVVDWLVSG